MPKTTKKTVKATKRTTKVAKPRVNKSEWIRNQPLSVSTTDLPKLARKEGMKITAEYASSVRSMAKRAAGAVAAVKKLERATKKAAKAAAVAPIAAKPAKASAKAPKKSLNGLAHTVQA